MASTRPYVLSIAGFDPTNGAGVGADLMTFEALKVHGMGVTTSITFQNEEEFQGLKWMSIEDILKQMEVLSKKYAFEFIKIGLVQNIEMFEQIISNALRLFPKAKIVWDPILSASSGYKIQDVAEKKKMMKVCQTIFLITPNMDEVKLLMGNTDAKKASLELSSACHVLLKGGHSEKEKGRDFLYLKEGKVFSFSAGNKRLSSKHGSGCVLSSAVTASLAKGYHLHQACLRGKRYTERFLSSTKGLLGIHRR